MVGPLRVGAAPNGLDHARVGFAVPRSVGGAVVRNRVRRRLRAAVGPLLPGLAGLDLVVAVAPAAAAMPFAELDATLRRCLEITVPRARAAEENGRGATVVRPVAPPVPAVP